MRPDQAECYYALTLSILSIDYITPEAAFENLAQGRVPSKRARYKRMLTDADITDMIKLKSKMTYAQVGELFGISGSGVCHLISNWKQVV